MAVLRFIFVDLLGFFLAYDLLRIQELLPIRFFFLDSLEVFLFARFLDYVPKQAASGVLKKSSKVK